jgi:activator of 2-hydroxyglutaryl-CoA dehydratase
VAERFGVPLSALGGLAGRSRNPAPVNSTCVVFAETELIGLLSAGAAREDIVAGVQNALAARVAAMAGGKAVEPIIFTGGVALVSGIREALERALGLPVKTAPEPVLTGALGAALLARETRE